MNYEEKRDISEYQLSLELGHSQGYIQSITSGRVLPSMTSFFRNMCILLKLNQLIFFDTTTPCSHSIKPTNRGHETFTRRRITIIINHYKEISQKPFFLEDKEINQYS